MTKLERECLKVAQREAERFHASVVWFHDGKHSSLTVTINGKSRKIALACTPRSDNQPHWVAQNVRKMLRELLA